MGKYALELAIKFSADSDARAKTVTNMFLGYLQGLVGVHALMLGESYIDEIALCDEEFHRAYGENRFVDLSEGANGGDGEDKVKDEGKEGDQ